MSKQVNAFNWKEYTDEEHARQGDPFKSIKRSAVISANVTAGIHKLREVKPSHGTIFGITEKRISLKAPDMMGSAATQRNTGRKLPAFDHDKAMALLAEGYNKREVAERLHVPYKSMLTFFKKMGAIQSRGAYAWTGKYKKENSK